jgi:MFS family permease
MGIGCVWLGIASTKNYPTFLAGRAFLGLFEAPIESIVPSTVTDIFFLHERGEKISVYGLGVLGGNEIGPLISAYIIQALGMNWAFYIIAMVIAVNLVTMFFTMPETKFTGSRPAILVAEQSDVSEKLDTQDYHVEHSPSPTKDTRDGAQISVDGSSAPSTKKTYLQSLAFVEKNDRDVSLIKTFLRPLVLMTYPTVIWSSIIYGFSLSWNVILGATVAQLFAPP